MIFTFLFILLKLVGLLGLPWWVVIITIVIDGALDN